MEKNKTNNTEKDILRFLTCGSVDDGKSTLLGRLLYDSKIICKDQLSSLKKDSDKHGTNEDDIDYALLLDGLSAEREQGITIDVAFRYFETPKRKFIVADTPGHEQYTRNMVTGASTAELALILIDARNGVLTQSKRHTFIVSLLQIPHLVVAVNKMDLVDYSEDVYNEIVESFKDFCGKLDVHDITFIPVSALKGDNIVDKSEKTPWYDGKTVLQTLENIYVNADKNLVDFRFPVQYVLRPNLHYRGFAGRIESGTISKDEKVVVLPSGMESEVKTIDAFYEKLDEAFAPQSVAITLKDEIDVSRGDMIVRKNNLPLSSDTFDTMLCWMSENKSKNGHYIIKHGTKSIKAFISKINYKVDVNTLHRQNSDNLQLNDIARVQITTSMPIFFDAYKNNRATGNFILIDSFSNDTVAAGMINQPKREIDDLIPSRKKGTRNAPKSANIMTENTGFNKESCEKRNGHKAAVLWFTGLSGSGKSTIARAVLRELFNSGYKVNMIDGDNLRFGLCSDLGFSSADRKENIRRVAEVSKLFFENGNITLCSFVSPYQKDRDFAKSLIGEGRFFEIFVKCSLDECRKRDPKGLYAKADSGEIKDFTGISAPYEAPSDPDLILPTENINAPEAAEKILCHLKDSLIIK